MSGDRKTRISATGTTTTDDGGGVPEVLRAHIRAAMGASAAKSASDETWKIYSAADEAANKATGIERNSRIKLVREFNQDVLTPKKPFNQAMAIVRKIESGAEVDVDAIQNEGVRKIVQWTQVLSQWRDTPDLTDEVREDMEILELALKLKREPSISFGDDKFEGGGKVRKVKIININESGTRTGVVRMMVEVTTDDGSSALFENSNDDCLSVGEDGARQLFLSSVRKGIEQLVNSREEARHKGWQDEPSLGQLMEQVAAFHRSTFTKTDETDEATNQVLGEVNKWLTRVRDRIHRHFESIVRNYAQVAPAEGIDGIITLYGGEGKDKTYVFDRVLGLIEARMFPKKRAARKELNNEQLSQAARLTHGILGGYTTLAEYEKTNEPSS